MEHVGFNSRLRNLLELYSLARKTRRNRIRLIVTDLDHQFLALLYPVKSSVGIGPLPIAIADSERGLDRVLGPIPKLLGAGRLFDTSGPRRTPARRDVLRLHH